MKAFKSFLKRTDMQIEFAGSGTFLSNSVSFVLLYFEIEKAFHNSQISKTIALFFFSIEHKQNFRPSSEVKTSI